MKTQVAPRRGAWVETYQSMLRETSKKVAPRRGAWVETYVFGKIFSKPVVAPRRGAWVETRTVEEVLELAKKSHPAGVRGLKPRYSSILKPLFLVAPRRGAWVETH